MNLQLLRILLINLFFIPACSCSYNKEETLPSTVSSTYKTEHVIILVMDGARYSETWGDSTHQYIPHIAALASQGVVCTNMNNVGATQTTAGHTAMLTGVYENINNTGKEFPTYPSVFQYWLEKSKQASNAAWVIATKDKLEVLTNCKEPNYQNKYMPSGDCGVAGLGSGYREDSTTFQHAINTLKQYHPKCMLINFKEPDASGHANNWQGYLQGIKQVDEYVGKLWEYFQSDTSFANKTTLLVTNDHGRHPDNIADGFVSHGDSCRGCKHIMFFALGPDFKKNDIDTLSYSQVDIAKTIATFLQVELPFSKGKIMKGIFK